MFFSARDNGPISARCWAQLMRCPVASSMSPRPIRLGGLPTGVSRPPTLAPYASISMIAAPTRSRSGSKSTATSPRSCSSLAITARMPSAVGSSIATVAVFDTNADSRQVMSPNAMITLRSTAPPEAAPE